MVTMATNDTEKTSVIAIFSHDDIGHNNEALYQDNSIALKIVVCMLTVFSVVGVIGNAIVFYIFCGRRSTSTSVVFILALAGVDFFACLVAIPYTIVFEVVRYNLLYDGACKMYMFLITSLQPFSAYIMVGIALDRYFCICHPFLYVFTVPRAKAVVLCMAIPALIFGVITALSHGMYIYEVSVLNANNTRVAIQEFTDKGEAEAFVALRNITSEHPLIRYLHYHQCVNNTYIFSREFLNIYKKFHAMNFVLAYISVAVLYILIYKSIFTRRVKKAKRRKGNLHPTSSNKTKDNNGEETQMTAINGCNISNTKSLNNQTRKDAKYARKITLTARNDPSVFGQSEGVTKSLSGLSGTGLLSQESTQIYPKQNDLLSNGNLDQSLPCLYQQNKAKRSVGKEIGNTIYRGPITQENDTVYVGPVCYESDTVYIGPEANFKNAVYIGQMKKEENGCSGNGKCHEDTTGVQVRQEKDTTKRSSLVCQDNESVYTGPQDCQNDTVYTGPQACQEIDVVYTGPQSCHEKDTVYTGPQSCEENDTACTALQTCRDGNGAYIGPASYNEDIGIYYFPSTDNSVSIVGINSGDKPESISQYTDPWSGQDLRCEQDGNEDSNTTSPVVSINGKKAQASSSSDANQHTPSKSTEPASAGNDFSPCGEAEKRNTGQSKNEFHNIFDHTHKNYKDKYEVLYNGDDDTNIQGFCSDGALPEEKLLLDNLPQGSGSSGSCYEGKSFKETLPVSPHSHVPEEDRGKTHSTTKHTQIIDTQAGSMRRKRPGTFKDRHLMANIKTAFMLFIVTLVFIIAYLPALLMANELVPFRLIGFYVYFIYNVANPFIYAFMNHTFREDLKKMAKVCKR